MDLGLSPSELDFQREFSSWLRENHPGAAPTDATAAWHWQCEWQRQLAKGGWACVHWPRRYGGRDATMVESSIFWTELAAARAPLPADVVGIMHGGPTVLHWGTEEQKERFLPGIPEARETWCQGFSEPGAGSDLAALRTMAKRDGDEWVVNGQKVWTTHAQYAKWCILLARTDADVPKHRGITYFVLDMQQPGVEVRPIRDITGDEEFNEVFLHEVRVPDENVIGRVGDGWKVTVSTLMEERAGIGFFLQAHSRQVLAKLYDELRASGRLEDPAVAARVGELLAQSEAIRLISLRGLKAGEPGPEGSLSKWLWAETAQGTVQAAADLLGPRALEAGGDWAYELLRARANSIEGGTTEIMKSIVAERILGLPRGR